MRLILSTLNWITCCVGNASDYFEDFRFYRTHKLLYRIFNRLDNLYCELIRTNK